MISPELNEQLKSIETRLDRIEKTLNITTSSSMSSRETTPSANFEQTPEPHHKPMAGNWLGIVAVICFVLAAGFIIKLSIESGWLTPVRQIALTLLFGFSLIGSGLMLLKADKEYASFLPAAGMIILYLAAFAAYRFYQLISFEMAIAGISIVSGMCIGLHKEIKHDIYPITAAVGAYIGPLILGLNTTAVFSLYYLVLCSLAFSTLSIWTNTRILIITSAYLAILVNTFIGFDLAYDKLIVSALAVHFLIFSVATYVYTRKYHRPLSSGESWGFFLTLIIFYAAEYYFIDRIQPGIAPWISLLFAGILIGLYLATKKHFENSKENLNSQIMILAFTTVVFFHSVYLELLPDNFRPWLFVMITLSAALLPTTLFNKKSTGPYFIPIAAILMILFVEYVSILYDLLDSNSFSDISVALAALASIWFFLFLKRNTFSKQNQYHYAVLGSAHLLAIMAFYQLTHPYNSLAVSASWLLYAICIIIFAFTQKDKVMAKSALFVLSLAAAKALLYDASSAATIVRIFCLLITGVALYGAGFFIRKIDKWTDDL